MQGRGLWKGNVSAGRRATAVANSAATVHIPVKDTGARSFPGDARGQFNVLAVGGVEV